MRIAHFSDLHLYAGDEVPAFRLLNKRLTGWINLRYRRGAVHRPRFVRSIAREIAAQGVDHVVVTGDLTNLALEAEFELAREVLEGELGLDPTRMTIVPGNHDVYTRGALRSRRFAEFLRPWQRSDLPELAIDANGGLFPVVKFCGNAAVVGLSTAVPRPPFVAAGELGQAQIDALARVIAHPEVARRTLVLIMHHPPVHPWSRAKAYLEGLRDAAGLVRCLRTISGGLVLHGHLHKRIQRDLRTDTGRLHQVGATSASLEHVAPDRMAGFNLYELGAAGVERIRAYVYSPQTDSFRLESVPKHV